MKGHEIETKLQNITKDLQNNKEFIYDLLLAYGKPKASITRLKSGSYNLSKNNNELLWKKNLFYVLVENEDLHLVIDRASKDESILKHSPRFIIVTNLKQLLAVDTKTKESLSVSLESGGKELVQNYSFFLPWAGLEKSQIRNENLADIKAAGTMARLYDEIRKVNPSLELDFIHTLNVFFSRLLFCFFAEDTEVYKDNQFTNSIASHTQPDGSGLDEFLNELFKALDSKDRSSYPKHLQDFPYVNGGLFSKRLPAPLFNAKARKLIIECGELDWSQINPDIFGSMIQAVVHPSMRASLGMHYTSVVNILKVIEPLFLEELQEEYENAKGDVKKLDKLLLRISKIKVFDPACGSGNFLIIAYKELRKLEHKIIQKKLELSGNIQLTVESNIRLENFYGIEIDDFASQIATLSLWLAKHQMNKHFRELFGYLIPLVPLTDTGSIVCGNAAELNWEKICPKVDKSEIYIAGNPPFQGARLQDQNQKADFQHALGKIFNTSNMDYISIWFLKGAMYIKGTNAKLALVSTNSICQGEHVALLWPQIFKLGLEICFAHTSFKWSNNAKNNAGVTCIIVGLCNKSSKAKYIFQNNQKLTTENINAYLAPSKNELIIYKRTTPISRIPKISFGNMPNDGGFLILDQQEKNKLIASDSTSAKFIKRFVGAADYIHGINRYCIWIEDNDLEQARAVTEISNRIEKVRITRSSSKRKETRELANTPHKYGEIRHLEGNSIIIPRHTSEKRKYIPIGFLNEEEIISDTSLAIYKAEPYIFGIISSNIHMIWTKAVAGRLKTDIRYSAALVYNNYPVPELKENQKEMITTHVFEVLGARENHPEKTLAELYDPDIMPADLKDAHKGLDHVVELCYRDKPFTSDEERLAYLFNLYEKMTKKND